MAAAADLDLAAIVPPGATLAWGEGAGEPRSLLAALAAQVHRLPGCRALVGISAGGLGLLDKADGLKLISYGGLGRGTALHRAGRLDILPCHMSALVRMIERGELTADVVMAQVSPPDPGGRSSLGVTASYLVPLLARAKIRIAEVNRQLPATHGDTEIGLDRFTHVVEASYPLPEVAAATPSDEDAQLARHAARLVPDGAVLQVGVGSALGAVIRALSGHRDLGIHSGLLSDDLVGLIEGGAVTNAVKERDAGVSTATLALGTRRVYDFVAGNPLVRLRSAAYTHDPRVLGSFARLVALNSALEVDLTGQVNAEVMDGAHVGAVGGLADFARAAAASPQGRSVLVLRSASRRGTVSRVVPRLAGGVVTLPRSDVDTVVTEYGVAELRACTLAERARRLTAIAHPAFRDELAQALPMPV
jgi:acyl-CoA hydrolase